MKRNIIYWFLIIAAVFSSCQEEEYDVTEDQTEAPDVEFVPGEGQILAVMPGTKVGYGDPVDGVYPVVWTSGDQIKLYSESVTSGKVYTFSHSESAGVAVFTGTPVDGDSRVAVYTSERAKGLDGDILKITFAKLRLQKFGGSLEENSVNLVYLPMWAKEGSGSDKGKFVFQNTCGSLMFRLNNPPEDLSEITITSKTRYISGIGCVNTLTGEMELIKGDKPKLEKTVKVTLTDAPVAGSDGIVVSLPAGTYEPNDLTVTLTYGNNTYVKQITSELTIVPGVIRPMPVISFSEEISIEWEEPKMARTATKDIAGDYPRIHKLNDGRFMLSYSSGGVAYVRFSNDNGETWGARTEVMSYFDESNSKGVSARMTAAVPDFAQLSESNPYHPGRIIYAGNYRPRELKDGVTTENKGWTTVHPYTISISVSDNAGKTWSKVKHVYKSGIWKVNKMIGCWEPFVLELPDGTVQIYFADETPYYDGTSEDSWNNISVIESKDGGDTWGEARVVAQNGANRDGMPVAALLGDKILLAIESTDGVHARLHPIMISDPIQGCWSTTVGNGSPDRVHPFQTSLKSDIVYSGAPYIITTDNYVVYSYQISDWWKPAEGLTEKEQIKGSKENNRESHSDLEVQICLKSEVNEDGNFNTMRSPSRPFNLDQEKEKAIWNSLCDLGNDEILAVSQRGVYIYTVRGKIVAK